MKYTKAVEMAVRYAKRSAKRLSQNYIGTEHLLLGILHGGADSMAATVLMDADIEEKNVIKLIMDLVSFGGDVAAAVCGPRQPGQSLSGAQRLDAAHPATR
jgi:ATP-dependent Clp protease ATP-binding subunit ClpC